MIKLHLGSGKRFLPGYVHIDLSDYPHINNRHTIDFLPMVGDGEAELIYCCHAFEYFDREEAVAVLAEWKRVLAPGGILRISVPDFAALLAVYGSTNDINRVLGPLYGKWKASDSLTVYHKTVYNRPSLASTLLAAGFRDIRDWDSFKEYPDHDDYSKAYCPHMDKTGIQISLNFEATK